MNEASRIVAGLARLETQLASLEKLTDTKLEGIACRLKRIERETYDVVHREDLEAYTRRDEFLVVRRVVFTTVAALLASILGAVAKAAWGD